MAILMEEPARYFSEIAAGKVVRYGAILKDAATGKIVGHLKETGQMGEILSSIVPSSFSTISSLNPISVGLDVIGNGINTYQIHGVQKSIDQIQETLQGLEFATNVAALSSIASLGVSVAGFAAINTKLNKIEVKLDDIVDDVVAIKSVLKGLHEGWDAMSKAKLQKAAENILVAEKASSTERRLELAKDAVADFALLRHYYSNLLSAQGLFEDVTLDISHLHEIIARYTFSCIGVLQAEFITGDLGSYRKRLETIRISRIWLHLEQMNCFKRDVINYRL